MELLIYTSIQYMSINRLCYF